VDNHDDRPKVCNQIVEQQGRKYIGSGADMNVILGQGTAMLEFQQQMPSTFGTALDAVIIPIGNGGLLSGSLIACADSGIRVFGAEPALANHCQLWLEQGDKHHLPLASTTIADGLRINVQDLPFSIIQNNVEKVFTVSESKIAHAMKVVFEVLKLAIEPSAAVAVAVLLFDEEFKKLLGKGISNVGIILEGGNVDTDSSKKLMPWLDCGPPNT
jgi:threonine dehydratase